MLFFTVAREPAPSAPTAQGANMPLTELNHYFVRAKDLERTKDFYVNALGFDIMPRPDFPFKGYWLGVNGKIQVHLGQAGIENEGLYYLGTTKKSAPDNSGVIDHIAFLATEPEKFLARFKDLGIGARPRSLPESELYQLFIEDPDGLTIELNFWGIKDAPGWGGENFAAMPRVAGLQR
jgi:catechol 2,3-dioxygenase-like lactoylglutathione lyase family enzyme